MSAPVPVDVGLTAPCLCLSYVKGVSLFASFTGCMA